MMRLIFMSGPLAGSEINTSARQIRIGRDPSNNDLVLDDPIVSGQHVVLQRAPRGAYVLEDLGTTNGTFVNGQPVTTVGQNKVIYLSAGDRFNIGSSEIVVSEGDARLMVTSGPKAGREMPLGEEPITFGRAPDNTFDLEDLKVSAYHAQIQCLAYGFTLQDNGSTNGTFVNGHRVQSHVLTDGDTIAIGDNELRFLIDEHEAARAGEAHAPADEGGTSLGHLSFVSGPHADEQVPLGTEQVVFGRRDDCTFTLSDLHVSSAHAAITPVDNGYVITDLGSSNGTFVNGQRITGGVPLQPGDLVEIGRCVAEFRASGGIVVENAVTATMITNMGDGSYELISRPKFVINDHVISAHQIKLGKDPSSELWLDGEGVDRLHATITWEDGFYIEDQSRGGTYVNDKRVVKEKLQTGVVLRVGTHMINVSLRGERCTLETIDAATALARIEVARESTFNLDQARSQNQAVVDQANTGFGTAEAAYKTVFKLDIPDADALINERKAKFKVGAPAWRPSTDVLGDSLPKFAFWGSIAAALLVCGLLYSTSSDAALLNHPLSEGHASTEFAELAEKVGLSSGCAGCHTAGNGVDEAKCAKCHEGFDTATRSQHANPENMKAHQRSPGNACGECHFEHQGTARAPLSETPTYMGASQACASGTCHPNQHQDEFARASEEAPLVVEAGPVPTFNLAQEEFHLKHAVVEQKKTGEQVTIGCTSCHAKKDADKGDALVESAHPGSACFRCHQGSQDDISTQCMACHNDEHAGVSITRADSLTPATSLPTGGKSLLTGGVLALAAFAPFLMLAVIRRARRGRRTEAMVTKLQEFPAQSVKRLIHSINTDKCVGCSMCVQACPASVLELVNHKSTIVNFDACIQCKKCEAACAFDALRMHDADKPPPMIPMPQVDNNYETPVEGMYLIGQASGTPQVKNAVNLGKAVVHHMAKNGIHPGQGRQMGAEWDVVIVGSGPAGLAAAVTCAELGLQYTVLEKQRAFSWTIRSYYHKGKPVMAEPNDVELVSTLPHWDTVREDLLAKWDEYIQHYQIPIRYSQNVTNIQKQGQVFNVEVSDAKDQPVGMVTGARVVIAIGTMGNPRKLGCPGDDMDKVANALVDPDEFKGKNILIVGGTDSAIEVVVALCETNKVWLSCRSAKFDRVKPKNLQIFEKVVQEGKVTPLWSTAMKEVTATTATLEYKTDKRTEQIPNDFVFAMIGGHPPIKWLKQIGVPYVDKPHSWSPPRTDDLAKQAAGG